MVNCEICNKILTHINKLQWHLSKCHDLKSDAAKLYYDKYLKKENEGICPFTMQTTDFVSITIGYKRFSNTDEANKKKLATNSIDYLMKVKGLSESEALIFKHKQNKFYSDNNKRLFRENEKLDGTYIRSMSRYCKEFWIKKGLSESDSIASAHTACEKNRIIFKNKLVSTPHLYDGRIPTQLKYWLKKGYSLKDAISILAERQRTFTLEKCKAKYGELEGIRVFENRQSNWSKKMESLYASKSFIRHGGGSKLAVSFINYIIHGSGINMYEFQFGNNEFYLYDEFNRICYYDLKYKNKIIEFHGDYWHCNPAKYAPDYFNKSTNKLAKDVWMHDRYKHDLAVKTGHMLHIVWEHDYKTNKLDTIEQCINFLLC